MKILQERPDFVKLRKKYSCVDMHFHTVFSDGAAKINQVLKKTRKLGIGISITDHNEIRGVLEYYKEKKDSDFIIPGIEVKSVELVDILFYFYDIKELKKFYEKEIKPNKIRHFWITKTLLPLSELYILSKKYKCLTSVAHPYGYKIRTTLKDVFEKHEEELRKHDNFEAINGGNSEKDNERAINYIKKNKKGFTGGSDGHSIYDLGRVVTCSKGKSVKTFLNNIKNKKNIVVGKEFRLGKLSHYGSFAANKFGNLFGK